MMKIFHPVVLGLMRPVLGRTQYKVMRQFVGPLFELILAKWDQGEDVFTHGAPLLLLFHHAPLADATDGAIATTYAMLAAQSLGLGSCMLGTTTALDRSPSLKAKYGIPPDHKIGLALVVGHPVPSYCQGIRRKMVSITLA